MVSISSIPCYQVKCPLPRAVAPVSFLLPGYQALSGSTGSICPQHDLYARFSRAIFVMAPALWVFGTGSHSSGMVPPKPLVSYGPLALASTVRTSALCLLPIFNSSVVDSLKHQAFPPETCFLWLPPFENSRNIQYIPLLSIFIGSPAAAGWSFQPCPMQPPSFRQIPPELPPQFVPSYIQVHGRYVRNGIPSPDRPPLISGRKQVVVAPSAKGCRCITPHPSPPASTNWRMTSCPE